MEINRITAIIVDAAYQIHRDVGPGLFESVYELVLADALASEGFRADLVVEDLVIVEIKSVEQLARVHKKQVLTYLKLSGLPVGLLINFGGELFKDNIKRLVINGAQDLKS